MKDEDEIGYGKPPVATQFSKGKSGNPKGRPRKHPDPNLKRQHTTSIVDDLRNELQQVTIITEAAERRRLLRTAASAPPFTRQLAARHVYLDRLAPRKNGFVSQQGYLRQARRSSSPRRDRPRRPGPAQASWR